MLAQHPGQGVRPVEQVAPGHLLLVQGEHDGVGPLLQVTLQASVEGLLRSGAGSSFVPFHYQLVALAGGEQGQATGGAVGILRHLGEQGAVLLHPAGDGGVVEEVASVFQTTVDSRTEGGEQKGEVELRLGGGGRNARHAQPGQGLSLLGVGEHAEHHLEDGSVSGTALHPQSLHQALEGQILVLEGPQGHGTGAVEQLLEGGVVPELETHDQGVHEEAEQGLEFRPSATGDGGA